MVPLVAGVLLSYPRLLHGKLNEPPLNSMSALLIIRYGRSLPTSEPQFPL